MVKAMLKRGFVLLPEGEHSNVIGFTPPLTISPNQLRASRECPWEEFIVAGLHELHR